MLYLVGIYTENQVFKCNKDNISLRFKFLLEEDLIGAFLETDKMLHPLLDDFYLEVLNSETGEVLNINRVECADFLKANCLKIDSSVSYKETALIVSKTYGVRNTNYCLLYNDFLTILSRFIELESLCNRAYITDDYLNILIDICDHYFCELKFIESEDKVDLKFKGLRLPAIKKPNFNYKELQAEYLTYRLLNF